MLRVALPPLVASYLAFVAMVLLARARPVERPRLGVVPASLPSRREVLGTVLGGYASFFVIVLVFHVWIAGEDDGALVDAVWGGAFLTAVGVAAGVAVSAVARIRSARRRLR